MRPVYMPNELEPSKMSQITGYTVGLVLVDDLLHVSSQLGGQGLGQDVIVHTQKGHFISWKFPFFGRRVVTACLKERFREPVAKTLRRLAHRMSQCPLLNFSLLFLWVRRSSGFLSLHTVQGSQYFLQLERAVQLSIDVCRNLWQCCQKTLPSAQCSLCILLYTNWRRTVWLCFWFPAFCLVLGQFLPSVRQQGVDGFVLSILLHQAKEVARGSIHLSDVLDRGPTYLQVQQAH